MYTNSLEESKIEMVKSYSSIIKKKYFSRKFLFYFVIISKSA